MHLALDVCLLHINWVLNFASLFLKFFYAVAYHTNQPKQKLVQFMLYSWSWCNPIRPHSTSSPSVSNCRLETIRAGAELKHWSNRSFKQKLGSPLGAHNRRIVYIAQMAKSALIPSPPPKKSWVDIKRKHIQLHINHQWSSDRILPCHSTDPGSIPSWQYIIKPWRKTRACLWGEGSATHILTPLDES